MQTKRMLHNKAFQSDKTFGQTTRPRMTSPKLDSKNSRQRGRRRGVAFVYLALIMVILLGMTGFAIDTGHLYMKEAQARRAADAAALAGAMQLPDEAKALEVAREYAALNKYTDGQGGTTVTGEKDDTNPNRYTVTVQRPESLFFMRVLLKNEKGEHTTQLPVGATATAEAVMAGDGLEPEMHVGSGEGVGPINLAVFGPYARYSHGDPYSTRWRDDGSSNSYYDENGYNFKLTISPDYEQRSGSSMVEVQIFDPDGQNLDGNRSPDGKTRIDEIWAAPGGLHPQPANQYTTTRYQLYKIVDPNDPSKDSLLGEAEYGATNPSIDMQWVTPQGFTFNVNDPDRGPGSYRINVKTVDGSSENGFNLRAVAPGGTTGGEAAGGVNPNGTSISAMGRLPINFNNGGLTTLELGSVPASAAGKTLTINKFDTDVGAVDVYYKSTPPASNQPPDGFKGYLTGDGQWRADNIELPEDYKTATWSATYQAGLQDTTVWELSYQTPGSGSTPGGVKLVGNKGKPY